MSEQEKQESQKTVVAFIAGLLIGGLLVWVFSGAPETTEEPDTTTGTTTEETTDDTPEQDTTTDDGANTTTSNEGEVQGATTNTPTVELSVGDASVEVSDQPAGMSVSLAGATFPSDEGWVGVREYNNGQLGYLLGVVRYSQEQGLVPESIVLQRPTTPGREYAIVFYSESGDRIFNLAEDIQIGDAIETFTAQ